MLKKKTHTHLHLPMNIHHNTHTSVVYIVL